jgi:hypothetical protein
MNTPHHEPADDDDIRALLRTDHPEASGRVDERIGAAMAAYDLAVRAHARDGRRGQRRRTAPLGTVAAATVLVLLGAVGGFAVGRGGEPTSTAEGTVIESVPVRGTVPACPPEAPDDQADTVGAVVVGDREITVRVRMSPSVQVTLVDASTCEVIIALP